MPFFCFVPQYKLSAKIFIDDIYIKSIFARHGSTEQIKEQKFNFSWGTALEVQWPLPLLSVEELTVVLFPV